MNELDFALDTKSLNDDGQIEGLAAGYGNVDFGGDVMLPGSISKSLQNKSRIPMLMAHDHKRPIGVWTDFNENSDGLLVKGRFAMSTVAGKEAHALVKDGAIGGLSVGLHNVKRRIVGKARHIVEAMLHEISLVTVPMNERTQILSVKDILDGGELPTVRQFEDFLRDAGGFSKSLAAALAAKATPLLNRGEPDAADQLAEFYQGLRA
jgi:HK97 family phage prohead protease